MRAKLLRTGLICSICIAGCIAGVMAATPPTAAQRKPRVSTKRAAPKPEPTPPEAEQTPPSEEPTPEASPVDEPQAVDTLKINTNLVVVPVIATNSDGIYVPDLQQNEFSVSENGVKQEVAFFATVSTPFHVVLVLDTSASTQDKLRLIQKAAVAFVEQLQSGDRIKLISFDEDVRDLSAFTNNRSVLEKAIYKLTPGKNTKLYDAFELALSSIRRIPGRKAIVLFSDGVDWHSDQASFDSTLRWLDEEGVIVYPIRFDTRDETERLAREQAEETTPQLPTIGVIRNPPAGTTAPTFPSDDPNSVPQSSRTGPFGLPLPAEILRGRRGTDPNTGRRYPEPDRPPTTDGPNDPRDGRSDPRNGRTDPRNGPTDPRNGRTDPSESRRRPRRDDSISAMLDQLYLTADSYLIQLASKSGGRLLRVDTLSSLPDAFAKIAAELRTQYAIGYYPTNKERDGKYRELEVRITRKNVILRSRPGYRAPGGG